MDHSYSTATEGGRPVRMRYEIRGRMHVPAYLEFVAERARWFGISGWAAAGASGVTVVAAGPEAMVGALEMACTLGPLSAVIEHVAVSEDIAPVEPGFGIRG